MINIINPSFTMLKMYFLQNFCNLKSNTSLMIIFLVKEAINRSGIGRHSRVSQWLANRHRNKRLKQVNKPEKYKYEDVFVLPSG